MNLHTKVPCNTWFPLEREHRQRLWCRWRENEMQSTDPSKLSSLLIRNASRCVPTRALFRLRAVEMQLEHHCMPFHKMAVVLARWPIEINITVTMQQNSQMCAFTFSRHPRLPFSSSDGLVISERIMQRRPFLKLVFYGNVLIQTICPRICPACC